MMYVSKKYGYITDTYMMAEDFFILNIKTYTLSETFYFTGDIFSTLNIAAIGLYLLHFSIIYSHSSILYRIVQKKIV